jgi:hypothetical protein
MLSLSPAVSASWVGASGKYNAANTLPGYRRTSTRLSEGSKKTSGGQSVNSHTGFTARNIRSHWPKRPPPASCLSEYPLALSFLLFAVVSVLFFWPWISNLSTNLIGPAEGDTFNDFWNVWYVTVASGSDFYTTNLIRYPEGTTLYYQGFAYPQLAAIWVISKIVGTNHASLITLKNIAVLLSFPLAGVGAFLLVRRFVGSFWPSLGGAFVFAFNPWHVEQAMVHAGISDIVYIPLFVFFYLEALEKRSVAWLCAAVAAYVVAALSSWYYFVYLGFFIVFHGAFTWIRERHFPVGWKLAVPLLCTGGVALLLLPLIVPMVLRSGAPGAYEGGWNVFVADVTAFFVPPPVHLLGHWAQSYYERLSGVVWEATVYLGVINIALMAWLCLKNKRRERNSIVFYVVAGMVVFGIMACGVQLHFAGHRLPVPLPDILLYKLPIIANLRGPARFVVLVYLFLAIGVGYAFLLIGVYFSKGRQLGIALALALAFDFYPANITMTDASCPLWTSIVREDHEQRFAVINLPYTYETANEAMFGQTCHAKAIVTGVLARSLSQSLISKLDVRDIAHQSRQLRESQVKYVVLHRLAHWESDQAPYESYLASYALLFQSERLALFRVY